MLQGIYVINLDRRPDRYAALKRLIDVSDLRHVPLQRISAYDSVTHNYSHLLSPVAKKELDQLQKTGFREHHSQLTNGAIGCYLSHYEVWKTVAESGGADDSIVVVLEDDATVPKESLPKMYSSLKKLQSTGIDLSAASGLPWLVFWEFICLEGCEAARNTILEPKTFWSTQAYSISVGTAKRMVDLPFFPIDVQIDVKLQILRDEGKLKIYGMPIFVNNGKDTDIQMPVIKGGPLRRPVLFSEKTPSIIAPSTAARVVTHDQIKVFVMEDDEVDIVVDDDEDDIVNDDDEDKEVMYEGLIQVRKKDGGSSETVLITFTVISIVFLFFLIFFSLISIKK